MKKFILLITTLLILITIFTGCRDEKIAEQNVVIAGLNGPTSMGMIKLFDEKSLNSKSYNVEYINENTPDNLLGRIINGEIQIAAVPTNLASVIYNKTEGKIQLLALNTLGVLDVVGASPINSLSDLKGETLYISGKGSTPDYAVSYILKQLGLSEEVTLQFYPDHASLAQAVIAGDAKFAVLPQPFVTQVTMKSENIKLLLDLNDDWRKVSENNAELAMGCLIVNKEFATNNSAFISEFLSKYSESVNWVNNNPADAGVLIAKQGILPDSKLAELAIPNCAIIYKSAQDSKEDINSFLKILMEFNPSSIGGKLPDENFYYSK